MGEMAGLWDAHGPLVSSFARGQVAQKELVAYERCLHGRARALFRLAFQKKKKILQGTGGTYITSILTTGSDLDGGRGSEVRSNKRAWWLTDVALAYFHFRFFYIIFVVCTSGMQESWRMYMFWANWWNCGRVANGDLPTLMHNIM